MRTRAVMKLWLPDRHHGRSPWTPRHITPASGKFPLCSATYRPSGRTQLTNTLKSCAWSAWQRRSASGLKVNAEPGERPDREGIKAHGEKARKGEGGPKSQPVPEHCRNDQEHRQRRQDEPKGAFRLGGNALGVGGILPQPDHRQDRNDRQRGDQTAEARTAARHL